MSEAKREIALRVFGVGNAGIKIAEQCFSGALGQCVAVDTDDYSLAASAAAEKVHLETKLLRGLGSGGDPARGRALAEGQLPRLKSLCEGMDVVFIIAGLGGGAGTGAAPVVAKAAKEGGTLALSFVTKPFECEGPWRARLAEGGLRDLKEVGDGVICLPNQKLFKLIDENTGVMESLAVTRRLLGEAALAIWSLLAQPGLIEIHFNELCDLIQGRHSESAFAVAEAIGATRSVEVTEKLLAHPMLDGGEVLTQSELVLVNLQAGPDLTMAEVNRVMDQINSRCGQAQLRMGAGIDESLGDRLEVTLIAARKETAPFEELRHRASPEELDTQLLSESVGRPESRFVPPAPTLPAEKMEQLLARQRPGGRRRKTVSRFQQTQLPLEIVSKGRFDRSEPTIHKGEDLDVPTYVRRGVALN